MGAANLITQNPEFESGPLKQCSRAHGCVFELLTARDNVPHCSNGGSGCSALFGLSSVSAAYVQRPTRERARTGHSAISRHRAGASDPTTRAKEERAFDGGQELALTNEGEGEVAYTVTGFKLGEMVEQSPRIAQLALGRPVQREILLE